MKRMTDEEVIAELRSDSPLNKARQILSSCGASIEQGYAQRGSMSPVEARRLEFEAVLKIASILAKGND